MTGDEPRHEIESAFLAACHGELASIKPGNVHVHAPGHGMDAATFERAAHAAAPIVADPGMVLGARVRLSVEASLSAAGCNANLGILLLAAPIAAAFISERPGDPPAFRRAIERRLAEITMADTADVFSAIAHASPGGLGEDAQHDVRRAPSIGLVQAMRRSADRDLVARQYAAGFRELFELGMPAPEAVDRAILEHTALGPAFAIYLRFAAGFPDSHIARKFGAAAAENVRARFARLEAAVLDTTDANRVAALALAFDADLKREGMNPGTSADLTVASLFARELLDAGSSGASLQKPRLDD